MKPNELLARIQRELSTECDPVPEGFDTINGWAKAWGYSRSRGRDYVFKAVKRGIMEGRMLRGVHPKKGVYKQLYYGPVTPPCRKPKR